MGWIMADFWNFLCQNGFVWPLKETLVCTARIKHTLVLDDPFDDQAQLAEHIPEQSPEPEVIEGDRPEDDWRPSEDTRPTEEIEAETRQGFWNQNLRVLSMALRVAPQDFRVEIDFRVEVDFEPGCRLLERKLRESFGLGCKARF